MKRGTIPLQQQNTTASDSDTNQIQYMFTHDAAVQSWSMLLSENVYRAFLFRIDASVTHIICSWSGKKDWIKGGLTRFKQNFEERLSLYKQMCIIRLDENSHHHTHMDNPEVMIPFIIEHFIRVLDNTFVANIQQQRQATKSRL